MYTYAAEEKTPSRTTKVDAITGVNKINDKANKITSKIKFASLSNRQTKRIRKLQAHMYTQISVYNQQPGPRRPVRLAVLLRF